MSQAPPPQATPSLLTPFRVPPPHLPTLEQAVAAQGNAVMLSGAAYGGKANLALAVFAALNCSGSRGMAGEPCGQCSSCRALKASAHPDLLHLRPRDTTATGKAARRKLIPIGAIVAHRDKAKEFEQHVLEFLEIRPTYQRRMVLIHGAEFLGPEAANALLKLIEEPPHGARFVLLTEDEQAVMPTIMSRSTRLRVPPLTVADLQQLDTNAPPTLLEFAAGRPEVLARAEAITAALTSAHDFTTAAQQGLLPALEAALTLEKNWNEWHPQALRFLWKQQPLVKRAGLDKTLSDLEIALQSYANPALAFMTFALEVRVVVDKA